MPALPYVQVRDLPPSASFYSAVMQPLGLQFISANSASIAFGNPDPTFEVRASPASADRPRPTRMVFSASSPSVVSAFHAAAKRAHPSGNPHIVLKGNDGPSGESRASAADIEGNILEIVYPGSAAGHAQSGTKQVTRILSWNLDASASGVGTRSVAGSVAPARSVAGSVAPARSVAGSVAPTRPGLATLLPPAGDESYRIIRRSFTTSTVESAAPQQESKGPSTGAMIGTMLGAVAAGVAVGAGISYALSKRERERAPRQEFDTPPFQRRASYQDPRPDQQQPRYVELERTIEKVRYPEQYSPETDRYPQAAYTTRRSQTDIPPIEEVDDRASRRDSRSHSRTRTRDRSTGTVQEALLITEAEHKSNVGSQKPEPPRVVVEDENRSEEESRDTNPKWRLHAELLKRQSPKAASTAPSKAPSQAPDTRSHVSSRSKHDDSDRRSHVSSRSKHDDHESRSSRSKHDDHDRRSSRSKHDDNDRRSHVSSRSKHDDHDRRSHAGSRHRRTRDPETEAETYVSARTDKSAGTVRPSATRSKAPSRAPSYASARDIPSPPKDTDWTDLADDDDKASVAPSDSISCVGERPKPHARDLPFLQTRERIMIG